MRNQNTRLPEGSRPGVLYIAFGDSYRAEAIHSAASLKLHSPSLATALFTDVESAEGPFDFQRQIHPVHPRIKVDLLHESPFKRTLYLDSDTEVVGDISDLFDLLDRFDVGLAHDFTRKRLRWSRAIPEYSEIPCGFLEMNGGVILLGHGPGARQFLQLWQTYFHRYKVVTRGWDQASLRIALWRSDARVVMLPVEYNVRSAAHRQRAARRVRSGEEPDTMRPRILHWRHLRTRRLWWRRFLTRARPYRF